MAAFEVARSLDSFLSEFPDFVRIDFACKQIDEEQPHEIAHLLLQGAQLLAKSIIATNDEFQGELRLWPTLLTTCEADAIISRDAHQDRGTILIGIKGDFNRDVTTAALKTWQADMKTTTLFIDYIPTPSLATVLISRDDLGQLVVDSWMCPELSSNPIQVFTPSSTSTIAIQSDVSKQSTRAGSSVAAATARRSPSPTKKLTPASSILNRLRWDDAFDTKDFVVVYEDRHAGLMESPVESWITESTEETFVPMHRVRAVRKKSTGMVVWHREARIDLVSGS